MDPAAQEAQFLEIWEEALRSYKTECSGEDLSAVLQLPDPTNLEALKQNIEGSRSKFDEYRKIRASLWRSLSNFLVPIEALGGAASQGAAVFFQASPAIMAAMNILIKGAKGVSQSYDYIEELFDGIKPILSRLRIHAGKDISVDLKMVYARVLACVLEILGASTKYVREGRAKRFGKRILKPDDSRASELKDKLQRLVEEETALVGALNLEASKATLDKTTKIDSSVEDIANLVKRLEAMQSQNQSTASSKDTLKEIKTKLNPQLDLEDDLDSLQCLEGTGDWVLKEALIQDWMQGKIPLLRLSGGPGVGKTYLSSLLINHLLDLQKKAPDDISIGYFFFKKNDPQRNCFSTALRTVAYQLASSDRVYRQHVEDICRNSEDLEKLASVWRHLFRAAFTLKLQSRAFIVLDGIDEAQGAQLEPFLKFLKEIYDKKNQRLGRVKFLMVGRRGDVDSCVEDIFKNPVPCVDVLPGKNAGDIDKYVSECLMTSRNLKKISPKLRQEVFDVLTSKADGMFLWVDLMIKEILGKNREDLIRKSLQNLPRGLSETYERMFQAFSEALAPEQDQIEDLNELLMWVGFANRPLSLAELETVLELRYGNDGQVIDLYDELTKKYASFFTVSGIPSKKDSGNDSTGLSLDLRQKRVSIVRLRHASLGDFLRLRTEKTTVGVNVDDVHLQFFKTCAKSMADPERMPKIDTQFQLRQSFYYDPLFSKGDPNPQNFPVDHLGLSLAAYALQNWWPHLEKIPIATTPSKDGAEVISYLYQIFTRKHILAARFSNYAYWVPIEALGSNPRYATKVGDQALTFGSEPNPRLFVDGDPIETVLSWIRDQLPSVETCAQEVRSWATGVLKDRSLLIYPMLEEIYFLGFGGGAEWTRSDPDVYRFMDLMLDYFAIYQPRLVRLGSDGRRQFNPIDLVEFLPMERNAIWYLSAANFFSTFSIFDKAQEYCVKAISATKPEEYYLRAQIYHLRAGCLHRSSACRDGTGFFVEILGSKPA
ncbi:hypothetical protein TWF481_006985 [Arthrobotrys musiformis]|uniref:Fungal STAND N-terminal Goodbye domain-containing protein n=1 Tax=Arthrobotrys musiformis TaxID=47236 RepID=A0AAV9WA75_9PEZI